MKNIHIGLALFILLATSSCGKFDDFNTNPDNTTKVTPEMLATAAELSSFRSGGDAKAYIGYCALPKYVAYITEGALDAQYNSIGSCSFGPYTILPNLQQMVSYASGGDYEASFNGLALYIKAYKAYQLTMETGDIPYSEAGKEKQGIAKPKYDKQEDVLNAILEDFKSAEAYFAKGRNFNGDMIFGGDVAKWRKAANAMQLKVLMSMSKKITATQKARFAEIVAAGNLMTSNDDNLQVVYTKAEGTWHPLYNQQLFDPYTTISELLANELKNLQDRRLFYFAEPASKELKAGKAATDYAAYVGANTAMDFNLLNVAYQAGSYSVLNKRYQAEMAGDPYVTLSYGEQCFIIAEAIELGWVSGNSKSYYDAGVTAGMKMVAAFDSDNKYDHGMAIDDAYIATYLAGNAAYKNAKADRLKQIWMQRYILKFMQDGYDSYFDFRRTGYPEFPNDPTTSLNIDNKNGFPQRWTYPSNEYQSNHDNIQEALDRQFANGYDGTNELMWILK